MMAAAPMTEAETGRIAQALAGIACAAGAVLRRWHGGTCPHALKADGSPSSAADLEAELWAEMWTTPQAIMWDQSPSFRREVASFVRWQVRAEQGDLDAAKEARMRSDRLGLNPLALLRLRAEVEKAEEAEDRGRRRRAAAPVAASEGDGGDDPRGVLYAVP